MELLLQSDAWIALLTLTFLEIILGIDNIIFISIVSNKLPVESQAKARNLGLVLALFFRIGLLLGISFIIGFTEPIFTVFDHAVSGRDLILAIGGIFLIYKSTTEIHHKLEGQEGEESDTKKAAKSFGAVIAQIVLLDIIFSFDSILTAIGLAEDVSIMIIAVIISLLIMMAFAGKISAFINKHPTLQMLALSFLILIGFTLFVEAIHVEIPKGYVYFAVFFSLGVEVLNIRFRKNNPVNLKKKMKE